MRVDAEFVADIASEIVTALEHLLSVVLDLSLSIGPLTPLCTIPEQTGILPPYQARLCNFAVTASTL